MSINSYSVSKMDSIEHKTLKLNGINMHVAETAGQGPIILLLHGFPECWYSWRHQIPALSQLGYRCLAPDLRGFGDTDAPEGFDKYAVFHVVGDLVALLDAVAPGQSVFVVGHDWGAFVAWNLSLFRPDKVRAMVNLSVPFLPRNPVGKPAEVIKFVYGDEYYISRFQEVGKMEAEFAEYGAKRVIKEFFACNTPGPLFLPKAKCFANPPGADIESPPWITDQEIEVFASKFEKSGFTGGLNYYRVLNLNWEMTSPWTGAKVRVPTKFIIGDLDFVYHTFDTDKYVNSEAFKQDVPDVEVVVLKGVAHWIQQEKPDEITKHIADFIADF